MSSQVTGDQRRRTVNKPAAAPGYDSEADGDAAARTGAVPMMCLRLVPYWSVHETLGVDAHNAPLKMRTRRIHLSRAVAWSCVRRHPVAGAALGSTDVDGSDPPAQGLGAGAGPCAFSRARPRALGGRSPPEIPSGKASEHRYERDGFPDQRADYRACTRQFNGLCGGRLRLATMRTCRMF